MPPACHAAGVDQYLSVFFLKGQPGRSSLASLPAGYLESQNTTQPQQKVLRMTKLRFLKATWTIDRATAGWAPTFPLLYEDILPSSAGASGWMSLSSPLRPLSHSLINFIPFLILFVLIPPCFLKSLSQETVSMQTTSPDSAFGVHLVHPSDGRFPAVSLRPRPAYPEVLSSEFFVVERNRIVSCL